MIKIVVAVAITAAFYQAMYADQRRTINGLKRMHRVRVDDLLGRLDAAAEQSVELIEAENTISALLADLPNGERTLSLVDVQSVHDAGLTLEREEHENGDVTWRLA